ncbi:MAG: hypothetical protein HPY54_15755 [Chthonomonadetes bacterium]|nr:hypothetical protein [Chthonomonadetes bacterium]
MARLDGVYGQRWQCEMVHSVIKRKFGDRVRSRRRLLQLREVLVKGLVYNIHRWVVVCFVWYEVVCVSSRYLCNRA